MSASRRQFVGLLCVSLMAHLWTKHNRAKPLSESASALFSIADANEFRFARFYIVCEAVPLGTLESPLIVCGLSDTLRESPNVAKTRNGMPATAWKKYVNFASKNLPPSVYYETFLPSGILVILLITPKRSMLIAAAFLLYKYHKMYSWNLAIMWKITIGYCISWRMEI